MFDGLLYCSTSPSSDARGTVPGGRHDDQLGECRRQGCPAADHGPAPTPSRRSAASSRSPRRCPAPADDRQRRHFRLLRLALGVIRLGPVLMLLGLVVAMTLLSPVFLTTGNASNVLAQTAAIAVLAIGQLLVILTRGIDLSVGSTLALASVVGALAFAHGNPGVVVIIVMLATGAAVGFVNGARLRVGPPAAPVHHHARHAQHRPRSRPADCPAASPSAACPTIVQTIGNCSFQLGAVLGVPRRRHRAARRRCAGAHGVGSLDLRDRRQPGGRPPHRHPGASRC